MPPPVVEWLHSGVSGAGPEPEGGLEDDLTTEGSGVRVTDTGGQSLRAAAAAFGVWPVGHFPPTVAAVCFDIFRSPPPPPLRSQ